MSQPTAKLSEELAVTIRHCHGLAEFDRCFELQELVWGKSNINVPMPMFVVAAETGGQMLGAFLGDASRPENMAGFTMAIAGWRDRGAFLHSHMTAVLPEHRDRGIGRLLKLFQRTDAIARGIGLVEWTFDPLEVKNAYFNLMKLGAIARRYLPNCYGITSSPLHGGLPTDRLVAEWRLEAEDVKRVLTGGEREITRKAVSILVSGELESLKASNLSEALRMQGEIRDQFQKWFAQDYAAVAIRRSDRGAEYLLEPHWRLNEPS